MTTQQNSDGGQPRARPIAPIQRREDIVAQQITSLMYVASHFMGFLANTRVPMESDTGQPAQIDGGAKCAVETSLIHTCNRLDAILTNPQYWEMESHNGLLKQLSEVYTAQLENLKVQSDTSRLLSAPQSRLSPHLIKLDGGIWAAYIGDPHTANSVVGAGKSVQEALDRFDAAIEGKTQEQLETAISLHAQEQIYEQTKSMDASRDRETDRTIPEPHQDEGRPRPQKERRLRKPSDKKSAGKRKANGKAG